LNEGESLLRWYQEKGRKLPFRQLEDPWKILVVEFLLHQTRISAVLPRLPRILSTLSDPEKTAKLDDLTLQSLWAGLGYYRRALYLRECARKILLLHKGKVPEEEKELLSLPGVGKYTARMIQGVVFGKKVPVIDGNIRRVLSRRWGIEENSPQEEKVLLQWFSLLSSAFPHIKFLIYALMDLGGTICLPRPRCELCPIAPFCYSYKKKNFFQRKEKKREKQKEEWILSVLRDRNGTFYLIQRGKGETFPQIIAPPLFSGSQPPENLFFLQRTWRRVHTEKPYRHTLTHRIYEVTPAIYELVWEGNSEEVLESPLIPFPEPLFFQLPLPTLFRKGIERLFPDKYEGRN
jgi:A/G-specific adenine glycosylase